MIATGASVDRWDGVTAPREILPGKSYLVTRRCTQRQLLLKPSRLTNDVVRYCLAVAAKQTGVLLHAVCFMSNHWHGVVTDPHARLPEFLERFHRLLAKAQNASLGRWENLWSSDKTSIVLLVSDDDVLEKMAYTIANPTAAGLVHSPTEWPGVITQRLEERWTVCRPEVFFDQKGAMPTSLTLQFSRPPVWPQMSGVEVARCLARAVERRVREARQALLEQGRKFIGANAVRRQSFNAVPKTKEPRRNPSPRIASNFTPARIEAIRRLAAFRRAYRVALSAWRDGKRDQVFPAGTYSLRIYARVACAPACPA